MTKRRRVLLRILACALATAALVYGLDDLSARFGVPARPRFSSYTVYRFYKIDEKFNKYSYEPMSVAPEQCVNALFPHFGSRPCWYVQRHTMQAIDVN